MPVTPAAAQPASITCAASVTENLGPQQTLRDLAPFVLPIIAFRAVPEAGQYKRLAILEDGAEVGLSVYRVNETVAHMEIAEIGAAGEDMLADTAIQGPITDLSYRVPGGSEMVTAWCYW